MGTRRRPSRRFGAKNSCGFVRRDGERFFGSARQSGRQAFSQKRRHSPLACCVAVGGVGVSGGNGNYGCGIVLQRQRARGKVRVFGCPARFVDCVAGVCLLVVQNVGKMRCRFSAHLVVVLADRRGSHTRKFLAYLHSRRFVAAFDCAVVLFETHNT